MLDVARAYLYWLDETLSGTRVAMSFDRNTIQLYSQRILELAANIPHVVRLDPCDASAKVRSPLCGSTVTVDVVVSGGRIRGFGQDVKACALGQAAASVVGTNIVGRSRDEVQTARGQLWDMLTNDGSPPSAPFGELAVLLPARDYRNRHASIMLVLDATLEAVDKALQQHAAEAR